MTRDELTLEVASEAARQIVRAGELLGFDYPVSVALIGAGAMAVHNYSRATEDLDLGMWVTEEYALYNTFREIFTHGAVDDIARSSAALDDPLGGVWRLTGDAIDPVEIINFYAPMQRGSINSAPFKESLVVDGLDLRVVSLPYLILLKLYAGSLDAAVDIKRLIENNQDLDMDEVRSIAARFKHEAQLDKVLKMINTF